MCVEGKGVLVYILVCGQKTLLSFVKVMLA